MGAVRNANIGYRNEKYPAFQTIDEAVSFWETHDSVDSWNEMEEVVSEVELRRNLLGVQPIIHAYQPQDCSRCGQEFEDVQIEYLVNDNGRLLMGRDLPALRCRENGHLFVLEENVDRLEQLMTLQGQNQIKPVASLTIPVYEFVAE